MLVRGAVSLLGLPGEQIRLTHQADPDAGGQLTKALSLRNSWFNGGRPLMKSAAHAVGSVRGREGQVSWVRGQRMSGRPTDRIHMESEE